MKVSLKQKRRLPILETYRRWGRGRWLMLALIIGVAAVVDLVSGKHVTFREFYLIPILMVASVDGLRPALVVSAICAVVSVATDVRVGEYGDLGIGAPIWDATVSFFLFSVMATLVFRLARALEDEHLARQDLLNAYIELDRSRKNQLLLKDQLLSHVSHELRTPLNAAYQFVAILRDGLAGPLNTDQQQYLQVAERNLGQLNRMIKDLLDTGRADSDKLSVDIREIDLAPLLHDTAASLTPTAREKGLMVQALPAPAGIKVKADPERVRQVLLNLLDNAIKFTPAGGHIIVRTEAIHNGQIPVAVIDTGKGIEENDRQRLFDRLYQVEDESDSSRRGLGLGLFICKQLIERMGGHISVASAPGQGSTFTFTLPVAGISH